MSSSLEGLAAVDDGSPLPWAERLMWGAVLLAAVLACAAMSYRFLEQPTQRLGRRLARTAAQRRGETTV